MDPSAIVRHLIDKAGLTQAELAALAGVTQPTISRIYAGQGCRYATGQALAAIYKQRRASK